ncbi:hypothetical protein WICANDRAFT_46375, partial [Wickerhamomyces anomalus NRRL Y-366-8]
MTKCANCEAEKTPMWRKTLDIETKAVLTLCNACGIYYKTKGCHRPKLLISKKNILSDLNIIRCSNCENINTSIWRRDDNGKSICNACGLFFKKKGYHR